MAAAIGRHASCFQPSELSLCLRFTQHQPIHPKNNVPSFSDLSTMTMMGLASKTTSATSMMTVQRFLQRTRPTMMMALPAVTASDQHIAAVRNMTMMSKQSGEEYKKQNYSARMKKTGRPVSPHVTIYAFPVGAISSITNRVTGCALSFGAAGLGALEIFGGAGTSLSLMQTIGSQGFFVAAPAKFVVAFPIVYHYGGAIRHFVWDYYPDQLNNIDVPKSSWALIGGSTIISAGFMFM